MKAFVATKIKVCNIHYLDEKKKYIACKIKRKWKQKSDFQGCYIKFIVAFHLCLLSSVLWHESSPLSNDFQENIPKRNLNPVTFHVIWSCITYNILRTVTVLKISSNCLDYKRQVFYSSFLLAYRVDSFASLSDVAHILIWQQKMNLNHPLSFWNADCVMISVADQILAFTYVNRFLLQSLSMVLSFQEYYCPKI